MTTLTPFKPCKKFISFGSDVQSYVENWRSLKPPRPSCCLFKNCSGKRLHYHGHYRRSVIYPEFVGKEFGVHRYRCVTCGKTVSFLPDFCIPYKHYGSDVVFLVLQWLVLLGYSISAIADPFGKLNGSGCSRWCVSEWFSQFERNSHNLWHFGLPRLLGYAPVPSGLSGLIGQFIGFSQNHIDQPNHSFRFVQSSLCDAFGPLGLFRAQLLPGSST